MNFKDYGFLTLLFIFSCFITSNHFLILNEETIVAICFISFIIFSFQYFGQSIQDSLDERNIAIKNEFIDALKLEHQYCQQIIYEHKEPIQKTGNFIQIAKTLLIVKILWYDHFRKNTLSLFFKQSLNILMDYKLNKRLKDLTFSKKIFEEKWLHLMATEFEASVLAEFQKANNKKFQEVLLTQCISAVKKEFK